MANDAHEAKRARWPGDFASVNGGSSSPATDDRLRSRASTRQWRDHARSAPRADFVKVSRPSEAECASEKFLAGEFRALERYTASSTFNIV